MSPKLKLISVIFVMVLPVISLILIATLTRDGIQSEAAYQYADALAKADTIAIQRSIETFTNFTLVFAVIIIVLAAHITFFVSGIIARPIVSTVTPLYDISGDDLTSLLTNNSLDEIGELSLYFNLTLEKIKILVDSIKEEAAGLSEASHELTTNNNRAVSTFG